MLRWRVSLGHAPLKPHYFLINANQRVRCPHLWVQFLNGLHHGRLRPLANAIDHLLPQVLRVVIFRPPKTLRNHSGYAYHASSSFVLGLVKVVFRSLL